MYKHILIPTDGSELATKAVTHGIALAKALGAKVTVLTVSEPFPVLAINPRLVADTPENYARAAREAADRILAAATQAAAAAGVSCNPVSAEHPQPYQGIIDAAQAHQCDLIVMASHGRRGAAALLVGSETTKVLTHSTIPVLVYR